MKKRCFAIKALIGVIATSVVFSLGYLTIRDMYYIEANKETASPTTETTTLDDIPQRPIIESDKDALAIVNIIDRTKTEGLPYDMAEEKFFEDGNNEYYFSGIYSHYVIVHYGDGSQEDIVAALNTGKANISDLDKFGVSYIVKPLELESAELSDKSL